MSCSIDFFTEYSSNNQLRHLVYLNRVYSPQSDVAPLSSQSKLNSNRSHSRSHEIPCLLLIGSC